jgi:cysteinyl-tRNA synthetase
MKLFNSLTRKIEKIIPLRAPHLGFYACGFTVYDYAHIGHLRRYTMDDVLLRTLKQAGFEVNFVQNITDVGQLVSDADEGEDKMEKGAKKYQTTVWELAKKFENYFFY